MRSKKSWIVLAIFVCLLSVWVVPQTALGQEEGVVFTGYRQSSNNLYFERGAGDALNLPESVEMNADMPSGRRQAVQGFVSWDLTAENAEAFALSKNFSVKGMWTRAETVDGSVYAIGVQESAFAEPVLNIYFLDRTPVTSFSVELKASIIYGTDEVFGLNVILLFKQPFGKDLAEEVLLQISDGSGFVSVDISDQIHAVYQPDFAQQDLFFTANEYAAKLEDGSYAPEDRFTGEELAALLTEPHLFRIFVKSGLVAGYSNTVSVEDGIGDAEDTRPPGNSGVLPPTVSGEGGNRGGGMAFWTSAGGITLAIALGLVGIVGCFVAGYIISARRARCKKQKTVTKIEK